MMNSSGRAVHEGTGSGAGVFYCGFRYTSYHGCACGSCDGQCGPNNGCPCPGCRSFWENALSQSPLRCRMGHYLERTQLHVIARRVGGYSGGFRCDLCGSSFSRPWVPLLHCSQCKFDVCPNCALSSVPNRGMPMMPQPGYGFPPQQPGYGYPPPVPPAAAPLVCDRGHPLMARPLSALQLENKGYSGGYICNRCRGRSNARGASPAEMVMHCPLCQFDLCPLCTAAAVQQQQPMPYPVPAAAPPMMMCERGHPLRATTISALGQVNPGYRGGYVCNRCRVGSGARGASLGEVVMHCDACNYDLCPSCARAMQPPPMPYAQPMPYMQPPPYSPY